MPIHIGSSEIVTTFLVALIALSIIASIRNAGSSDDPPGTGE